jgi:hypothetical protein
VRSNDETPLSSQATASPSSVGFRAITHPSAGSASANLVSIFGRYRTRDHFVLRPTSSRLQQQIGHRPFSMSMAVGTVRHPQAVMLERFEPAGARPPRDTSPAAFGDIPSPAHVSCATSFLPL